MIKVVSSPHDLHSFVFEQFCQPCPVFVIQPDKPSSRHITLARQQNPLSRSTFDVTCHLARRGKGRYEAHDFAKSLLRPPMTRHPDKDGAWRSRATTTWHHINTRLSLGPGRSAGLPVCRKRAISSPPCTGDTALGQPPRLGRAGETGSSSRVALSIAAQAPCRPRRAARDERKCKQTWRARSPGCRSPADVVS